MSAHPSRSLPITFPEDVVVISDSEDEAVSVDSVQRNGRQTKTVGKKRARSAEVEDVDANNARESNGNENANARRVSSSSNFRGGDGSGAMCSGGEGGVVSLPLPSSAASSALANATSEQKTTVTAFTQLRRQVNMKKDQISVHTRPVDPMNPHRGSFSIFRLPISDLLTPSSLQQMLSHRPAARGQVKMLGKVIETPRYFQMYLRSYVFTGINHEGEPELPSVFQPILDFLNSDAYLEATAGATTSCRNGATAVASAAAAGAGTAMGRQQQQHERRGEEDGSDDATSPRRRKEGRGGGEFNGVLVNWYLDGGDYIGPHAYTTTHLLPQSDIVTVSFGASRVFRIRGPPPSSLATSASAASSTKKKGGGGEASAKNAILHDIVVRNGDVLVMHGAFQEFYKHEIVKITAAAALATTGPRISVTFRQFK